MMPTTANTASARKSTNARAASRASLPKSRDDDICVHPATDRTEQPPKRIFAASRGGKDHRQPQSYREDAPRVAIGGELIDDEQRGVRHVRECGNHFAQPIADCLRPIGHHQHRVGARRGSASPRGWADPIVAAATRGPGHRRAGQSAHSPARGLASPVAGERRRPRRQRAGRQQMGANPRWSPGAAQKLTGGRGASARSVRGLVTHSTILATRCSLAPSDQPCRAQRLEGAAKPCG